MRPLLKLFATIVAFAVVGCLAICLLIFVGVRWTMRAPSTPTSGFAGDWRPTNRWGTLVERALPPAAEVVRNFDSWQEARRPGFNAFYRAHWGGLLRQSQFEVRQYSAELPLGTHTFPTASFIYQDGTNGSYRVHWTMRGRHDCDFLRMDQTMRGYYLRPIHMGQDGPPTLEIMAIEGITPFER
jgi:hypothetical protein